MLQLRAGTLDTCNLTTHASTGKHGLDLLVPVGPSLSDGACRLSCTLTLLLRPWPLTGWDFRMGFRLAASSRFGTLSDGLHTPSSAQRQHAILGYWREHARCNKVMIPSLLHIQSCDIVSQITICVRGSIETARRGSSKPSCTD